MKKNLFKGFVLLAFISLLSLLVSCSNVFSVEESSKENDSLVISLNKSSAKMISAATSSISDVTAWTVTLTAAGSEKSYTYSSTDSNVTVSENTLTVSKVPEGTYTLTLEGTASGYTLYGTAGNVVISPSSAAAASILLGLKKEGSGSISLKLADSGKSSENVIDADEEGYTFSDFLSTYLQSITLTSIEDSSTKYSYTLSSNENTLSFNTTTGVLSGSNIQSGIYKISFSAVYPAFTTVKYSVYVYDTDNIDGLIEIADGVTTESTVKLCAVESKTYYATNTASTLNGLSSSSRVNLSTLFEHLTANLPNQYKLLIYVNGTPEFELDYFEPFLTKCQENNRSFEIYNDEDSEDGETVVSLSVDDDDTEKLNPLKFRHDFILTAGTKTSLDDIELDMEDAAITLKNGAVLNVTDSQVRGTDVVLYGTASNFAAYTSKPFMTADTSGFEDDIKFDGTGEEEASSVYAVHVEDNGDDDNTVYSYYLLKDSPAVYLDEVNLKLNQLKAYDADTITTVLTASSASAVKYCFDSDRNLYVAAGDSTSGYTLSKYNVIISTGLYGATADISYTLSSTPSSAELTDIYFNDSDDCVYCLFTANDTASETTSYIYKTDPENSESQDSVYTWTVTLSDNHLPVEFNQLAVYDSTLYLSDGATLSLDVYSGTLESNAQKVTANELIKFAESTTASNNTIDYAPDSTSATTKAVQQQAMAGLRI